LVLLVIFHRHVIHHSVAFVIFNHHVIHRSVAFVIFNHHVTHRSEAFGVQSFALDIRYSFICRSVIYHSITEKKM
jgi:hypothetical protein